MTAAAAAAVGRASSTRLDDEENPPKRNRSKLSSSLDCDMEWWSDPEGLGVSKLVSRLIVPAVLVPTAVGG